MNTAHKKIILGFGFMAAVGWLVIAPQPVLAIGEVCDPSPNAPITCASGELCSSVTHTCDKVYTGRGNTGINECNNAGESCGGNNICVAQPNGQLLCQPPSSLQGGPSTPITPGTPGASTCTNQCADTNGKGGLCIPNPLTDCSITQLLDRVINILMVFAALITVAMIIFAGLTYVTAGGNSDRIKTANKTLIYALIGLAVVLLSRGISAAIRSALGGPTM